MRKNAAQKESREIQRGDCCHALSPYPLPKGKAIQLWTAVAPIVLSPPHYLHGTEQTQDFFLAKRFGRNMLQN
jgi:hypothetical protein